MEKFLFRKLRSFNYPKNQPLLKLKQTSLPFSQKPMAEFILSQVDYSTHPQSVYMKSTLILSSHLRLGIPKDILLGLSGHVMCLPTHATSPIYVILNTQ